MVANLSIYCTNFYSRLWFGHMFCCQFHLSNNENWHWYNIQMKARNKPEQSQIKSNKFDLPEESFLEMIHCQPNRLWAKWKSMCKAMLQSDVCTKFDRWLFFGYLNAGSWVSNEIHHDMISILKWISHFHRLIWTIIKRSWKHLHRLKDTLLFQIVRKNWTFEMWTFLLILSFGYWNCLVLFLKSQKMFKYFVFKNYYEYSNPILIRNWRIRLFKQTNMSTIEFEPLFEASSLFSFVST